MEPECGTFSQITFWLGYVIVTALRELSRAIVFELCFEYIKHRPCTMHGVKRGY